MYIATKIDNSIDEVTLEKNNSNVLQQENTTVLNEDGTEQTVVSIDPIVAFSNTHVLKRLKATIDEFGNPVNVPDGIIMTSIDEINSKMEVHQAIIDDLLDQKNTIIAMDAESLSTPKIKVA